jgi:hypothetical protein
MSAGEAVKRWNNPALKTLGSGDLLMLECKEGA